MISLQGMADYRNHVTLKFKQKFLLLQLFKYNLNALILNKV